MSVSPRHCENGFRGEICSQWSGWPLTVRPSSLAGAPRPVLHDPSWTCPSFLSSVRQHWHGAADSSCHGVRGCFLIRAPACPTVPAVSLGSAAPRGLALAPESWEQAGPWGRSLSRQFSPADLQRHGAAAGGSESVQGRRQCPPSAGAPLLRPETLPARPGRDQHGHHGAP